jgi:serine/threonine protein kinase
MESLYGGQAVKCPACGAAMTAPGSLQEGHPEGGAASPSPGVIQTLQSSIDRGAMTITQFMAQQHIEGVIDLQGSEDKSTASAVLTAEQGRKYKLGDVVAAGGMGAILDAKDVNLRRGVAMKVMLEPEKAGKDQILRFIQEAQVTSQLEHPSIVPVHELGVDAGGNVFYTMKFVKGRSLKDILEGVRDNDAKTVSDYPLSHLLMIFQKVCDAIAFAHSKRVIHRDLKPENVMVGDYGEVQVMDWGLAKVLPKKAQRHRGTKAQSQKSDIRKQPAIGDRKSEIGNAGIDSVRGDEIGEVLKTMDGQIMGTPGFMSPEQAMGKTEEVDERTDIYALGAILYNILTLDVPVKGKTLAEIIDKVTTGKIVKPTEYNDKRIQKSESRSQNEKEDESRVTNHVSLVHLPDNRVPESLSAVTMRALEVEAHRRYQTVKDLQKEIQAYQGGFATRAEDAGTWKQFALFVRRNKGVSTAVIVAMLAISVVVAASYRVNLQARKKAETSEQRALVQQAAAEKSFADFKAAQKASAPSLLTVAREKITRKEYSEALSTVLSATSFDPNLAEGWFWVSMLRIHAGDFAGSLKAAEEYRRLEPSGLESKSLVNLCRKAQEGGLKAVNVVELTAMLIRRGMFAMAAEYGQKREDLVVLYRSIIEKAWPGQGRNLTDDGKDLTMFFSGTKDYVVADLTPLKDIPITVLHLKQCRQLSDLGPLKGMPLTKLDVSYTAVSDLTPLKGMALTNLCVDCTGVADLGPLKNMPLKRLYISGTQVSDLSVLKGMQLISLEMADTRISSLKPLEGMQLTELTLRSADIRDISVLRNMPLKWLELRGSKVTDLTPIKGMPLKSLLITGIVLNDLSLLKGMPLVELDAGGTSISDTSELKGMQLTALALNGCPINDLTPLQGMSLTRLDISDTKVSNLVPLAGMPMQSLSIRDIPVSDITCLKDMPLVYFQFTPKMITNGVDVVRKMRTLVNIGISGDATFSAAEFWKKYDAGEFK